MAYTSIPLPDGRTIPPCVAAAQDYLRFAEQLRSPPAAFDGGKGESRDLTPREQVVYDAALEVLRLYFSGEKDYAAPQAMPPEPPDDDPRRPVVAEA